MIAELHIELKLILLFFHLFLFTSEKENDNPVMVNNVSPNAMQMN